MSRRQQQTQSRRRGMYPPNIQSWFDQKSPVELSIQGHDKSREALRTHQEKVLDELTKNDPEWLERVIHEIRHEVEVGQMPEPVRHLCHTLMKWLRTRGFMAQIVEDVLHRLLQEEDASRGLVVNQAFFSIAIDAWVRQSNITRDAPRRAEALFQLMQDRYKENPKSRTKPRASHVAQVLAAWSNSTLAHAPQRAEQLLEWMESKDNRFSPSVFAYNSVIQAYARHDRPQDAERILRLLEDRFRNDPENAVRPNVRSFKSVMEAWALSGQGERGAYLAEAVRKRLNDLYKAYPYKDLKPNVDILVSLMDAWAKSYSPREEEKVEELWNEIVTLHASLSDEERKLSANQITEYPYKYRMEAWGKIGKPEKAEEILNSMLERVAAGDKNAIVPSRMSWTTVAHGWAQKGKVKRAEDMLKRLHEHGAERSVVIYNALLLAWVKSKDPTAANKAHRLLDWMEEQANNGMEELRPNEVSYNLVLSAWRASRQKHIAGTKVNGLLDRMEAYLETHPVQSRTAVSYAYEGALATVARGGEDDTHLKVIQLLQRIEAIHKSKTVGPVLTNNFYHLAVASCAWAPTRDGEELAEDILRRMEASPHVEFQPKRRTYEASIAAWARTFKDEAPARAYAIFKRLEERAQEDLPDNPYKPTQKIYNFLLVACLVSRAPEAEGIAHELLEKIAEKRKNGDETISLSPNVIKALFADAFDRRDNISSIPVEDMITKIEAFGTVGGPVDEKFLLDCYSFALTILGWSTSNDAADRAGKLWQRMNVSRYVSPNLKCFNELMYAYSNDMDRKDSDKTSPYKAEALLRKAERDFSTGAIDWRPNTLGYDNVIEIWAKSKVDGAPDRAFQLLERMDIIYKKFGSDRVKPSASTYGMVLLACANTPAKSDEKKLHHFNIAVRAFNHLQESDYCKPDRTLYNRLLMCAIYLAPDRKTRVKMTRHIFTLCCSE